MSKIVKKKKHRKSSQKKSQKPGNVSTFLALVGKKIKLKNTKITSISWANSTTSKFYQLVIVSLKENRVLWSS